MMTIDSLQSQPESEQMLMAMRLQHYQFKQLISFTRYQPANQEMLCFADNFGLILRQCLDRPQSLALPLSSIAPYD